MLIFFPPSLLAFGFSTGWVGKFQPVWEGSWERPVSRDRRAARFQGWPWRPQEDRGRGWQRGRPGAWALPRMVPSSSSSPIPVYRVLLEPHPLSQPPSSHTSWGEESGWQGLSKGPSLHSRDLETQGCWCSRLIGQWGKSLARQAHSFFFLSWKITALECCVGFCCTTVWLGSQCLSIYLYISSLWSFSPTPHPSLPPPQVRHIFWTKWNLSTTFAWVFSGNFHP